MRFWGQPSKRYRNFQIAFTILTLNFLIPAVSYAVSPQVIGRQFADLNHFLGGQPYLFPEAGSRLWRYLGAANVMTLALMCLLLQLNLKRALPVLLPLLFLKGYNASLFLIGYLRATGYPVLLAVALFDYLTCAAFALFALRAYRDIAARADDELVPRPLRLWP